MKGRARVILFSVLLLPSLTFVSVSSYLTNPYVITIQQKHPKITYVLISLYFLLLLPVLWLMRKARKDYNKEKLIKDI